MTEIATSHQLVVIARLAEFCQWRGSQLTHDRNPWLYMRDKLLQIEEPLAALKAELYRHTARELLVELRAGAVSAERFADYRSLFEKLLSRGDFADLAIHLAAAPPPQAAQIEDIVKGIRPFNLFDEERRPAAERSPAYEKLIAELTSRLRIDVLGKILARKPRTPRRRRYVLRRLRANVAEYCTVVHVPLDSADTFTPFMLPRIEAIIAANLRLLSKYR